MDPTQSRAAGVRPPELSTADRIRCLELSIGMHEKFTARRSGDYARDIVVVAELFARFAAGEQAEGEVNGS